MNEESWNKTTVAPSELNAGLGTKNRLLFGGEFSPSLFDLIDDIARIAITLGEQRASDFPDRQREKDLNEDLESAKNELSDAVLMDRTHETNLLRRAARLIHDRRKMVSGSLEMGDCDEFCKSVGLEVWKWPL